MDNGQPVRGSAGARGKAAVRACWQGSQEEGGADNSKVKDASIPSKPYPSVDAKVQWTTHLT